MRKPKSEAEVKAEIAALKAIKPKVRRYTAFGDDNWRKIDVVIEVLERGFDEDDLDRYSDADENSLAYETIQWREGEQAEAPSEGWPLAK